MNSTTYSPLVADHVFVRDAHKEAVFIGMVVQVTDDGAMVLNTQNQVPPEAVKTWNPGLCGRVVFADPACVQWADGYIKPI